jgi:hypothetical protein
VDRRSAAELEKEVTCRHGTSIVAPLAADFKDDEELRVYLGLPRTEEGYKILSKITPEMRKTYASMRAVERELEAGRVPIGVIVCDRRKK